MQSLTLDTSHQDNIAWHRQIAAGWARKMIMGDSPGAWARNTDLEVQFAIKHLRLQPGDRLLDLGCGWGRHSLPLATYGTQVTGVDLSAELLSFARHSARRHDLAVEWVEADIMHMLPGEPFDAVAQFCCNLLTWYPDRERTLEALWHVTTLLRPGGRVLLGTHDWQPDLPLRSQHWDEWPGGAAIYRQKYDRQRRMAQTQTVIFGPDHERHEYRRHSWWPSMAEMETLFSQVGLAVCGRFNAFVDAPFNPHHPGLVYVLELEEA